MQHTAIQAHGYSEDSSYPVVPTDPALTTHQAEPGTRLILAAWRPSAAYLSPPRLPSYFSSYKLVGSLAPLVLLLPAAGEF